MYTGYIERVKNMYRTVYRTVCASDFQVLGCLQSFFRTSFDENSTLLVLFHVEFLYFPATFALGYISTHF